LERRDVDREPAEPRPQHVQAATDDTESGNHIAVSARHSPSTVGFVWEAARMSITAVCIPTDVLDEERWFGSISKRLRRRSTARRADHHDH
jgi:hypothetical protein